VKKRIYIWVFLALLAVYITLALVLPPDPQTASRLGLSDLAVRLLNLTVVIPISLVYLTALYGFVHIDTYANKVLDTKEGPHFKTLANGLAVLVFSLPVTSVLGSLRSYARHAQPDLLASVSIMRNYVVLVLAVAALVLIAKGAQGLYGTLKRQSSELRHLSFYGMIGPVLLASLYTWLVIAQGYATPGDEPYFLPDWLIILTIVVPYVFAWCLGIRAALQLRAFRRGVKGVVYKRAINSLAVGIAVVILVAILIQGVTSLGGALNRLNLTPLLALVYFLVSLYVVGYGLIARGAKKLKQMEEA